MNDVQDDQERSLDIAAPEASDQALVERLRRGDMPALEIIMRRYNQRLYRIARSILRDADAAEDAVQQTYVRAYYGLEDFKPFGSFAAWLSRIAVNEALMIKRSERRYPGEPDAAGDRADWRTDPVRGAANRQLAHLIEEAIDRLPDEFRSVFVLRSVQQLSTRETAVCLGINAATVKTRLHRARRLMQVTLDRHIAETGLSVFEFAGARCDRLVAQVLARLESGEASGREEVGSS